MLQGRFNITGNNLFLLTDRLSRNQNLCRLLKYSTLKPLEVSESQPDIDGTTLINSNILLVPKISDAIITKESFVAVTFDDFYINPENNKFKVNSIHFNVLCPYDAWVISAPSLRPFLLMQEIDTMFNGFRLNGIGELAFLAAKRITMSPDVGGYSMGYAVNDFN